MATEDQPVSTRIDSELNEQLEQLADRNGRDKSDVIEDCLRRGVQDRDWTRNLVPIFKEATSTSIWFALLMPVLMLFFTGYSITQAFVAAMVFVMVGVASMLLTVHFADGDPDEVFG